jgi:hypothetical protein
MTSSLRKSHTKVWLKKIFCWTVRRFCGRKMTTRETLKSILMGAATFFAPKKGVRVMIGMTLAKVRKKTERMVIGSSWGKESNSER